MLSPVQLTSHQQKALGAIKAFVQGPGDCFILEGGADTGKTMPMVALLSWLKSECRSQTFLFPKVSAARILGDTMDTETGTIHIGKFAFSSRSSHA